MLIRFAPVGLPSVSVRGSAHPAQCRAPLQETSPAIYAPAGLLLSGYSAQELTLKAVNSRQKLL
jgi:hypothetical protein